MSQLAKILTLLFFLFSICTYAHTTEKKIKIIPKTQKYALLIGISDYQDENIPDLKYAHKDVLLLGSTLIASLNFEPENVIPLINSDASKKNIENQINFISEYLDENDIFLIHFSGHGTFGDDLDGDEHDGTDEYLIPWDAEYGKLYTAIPDDIFGYWLKKIKCKNTIVIFDSCHSGGAAKGTKGFRMTSINSKALPKDNMVADINKENVVVLSASKADELAQEDYQLNSGQGVFTYFLCEALKGAADYNNDLMISLPEIYDFAYRKVKKWTFVNKKPTQTPMQANIFKSNLNLSYTKNSEIKVTYYPSNKKRIIIEEEKVIKSLVAEGYTKTVKTPGHWEGKVNPVLGGRKKWIPGKTKEVQVPPKYEITVIPAKYMEMPIGHGYFKIVD